MLDQIYQRPGINAIAQRDQSQRVQINAELTVGRYLRLFATVRPYSHSVFVLFAFRYSRLFTIPYSGFPDSQQKQPHSHLPQQKVLVKIVN